MQVSKTKFGPESKLAYETSPRMGEVMVSKDGSIIVTFSVNVIMDDMAAHRRTFEESVKAMFDHWFAERLREKFPVFVEGIVDRL